MNLNELFRQIATASDSEGLRQLAVKSGLSEDEVIVIAVSRMFHDVFHADTRHPSQDLIDDIRVELAFERRGRTVGGITYLHAPEDFIRRVEQRIAEGIPLPHEDDDSLENFFLFDFLPDAAKAQAKAVSDPLAKRHLIVDMLKRHLLDYPTEENLSEWESRGLIERRPKEKSQQLADFFEKHGFDNKG